MKLPSFSGKRVTTGITGALLVMLIMSVISGRVMADATDTDTLTVTVPELTILQTHGDIDFGTATAPEQYTAEKTGDITAGSNFATGWTCFIRSDYSVWDSDSGDLDKPCGDLEYKGGEVSDFTPITTSDAQIESGTGPGTETWTMTYQVWIRWSDLPGNYLLEVTFTVTTT